MDAILQRLLREYNSFPSGELAHRIVGLIKRSSNDNPAQFILPLCNYGPFMESVLSLYPCSEVRYFHADAGTSVHNAVTIAFEATISQDCEAMFESDQNATILWPLSRAEDQADARSAFFHVNIRDSARDVVYSYNVNDNVIDVDNELGQTGWGTQSNFRTYLEGVGFDCDVNFQQNYIAATLDLSTVGIEAMDPRSAVKAMTTFNEVLRLLNITGPTAFPRP